MVITFPSCPPLPEAQSERQLDSELESCRYNALLSPFLLLVPNLFAQYGSYAQLVIQRFGDWDLHHRGTQGKTYGYYDRNSRDIG